MVKRIFRAVCAVSLSAVILLLSIVGICVYHCIASLPEAAQAEAVFALLSTWPLILVGLSLLVALTVLLSLKLSRRIVAPLSKLNLDLPRSNETYAELNPLLGRIESQQRRLREQSVELQRKKNEFDTATNHMSEGLVLLGESGTVLAINRAAVRLLGITTYCIGQNLFTVCHSAELASLWQRAQAGEHADMRVTIGGENYQINAGPTVADGTVAGVTLLIFDITEKEKAERMRREFTANVSHELKTPLHTISGYAELLSGGMVKEEDIPKFSGQIYAEAKRMIALVEDIIKLSRLDEGATETQRENIDLYSMANEVVNSLAQVAEAADVRLSLKGTAAPLFAIRQFISIIIYNLCDNAIKYNRPGGSVNVTVINTSEYAVLTVHDTGIGIPESEQERVFERFYRVDKSHSKSMGGTGLGLSIVKHAAKLHNAKIKLNSIPEEGTTVTVYFPK